MAAAKPKGPGDERTLILIKPDGVQRGLMGRIISRFEERGYKCTGLKMLQAEKSTLETHYAEHKARPFFPGLISYMSSTPLVAMIWEGKSVVKNARKMVGATNPEESTPGTIRGDYAIETGRNLIHGSDSVESAGKEICLWFPEKEYCPYLRFDEPWVYERKINIIP
jgi:nucleoside-diphosphate kinase